MANTKTANKTTTTDATAEPKPAHEVVQAARAWTATLREAGKAVAENAIAMQDRNVQFTQLVVDHGLKQIEDQTASLRKLYDTLTSQSDERRAAFRDLGREAAQAYIGLLAAPVKLARRAVESVREPVEDTAGSEA